MKQRQYPFDPQHPTVEGGYLECTRCGHRYVRHSEGFEGPCAYGHGFSRMDGQEWTACSCPRFEFEDAWKCLIRDLNEERL